ncbi:MAG: NAD-dependent epimerase/dehydratase family protein [Hyphomicrobiales bacterium]
MRVLVTGSAGFIGSNLLVHLRQKGEFDIRTYQRGQDLALLAREARQADVIVHLAGANRLDQGQDFKRDTVDLTRALCDAARRADNPAAIYFASSRQIGNGSHYAASKQAAEAALQEYAIDTRAMVGIDRLPNVFGKWARPNYNSVFATFCYNIARGLPIRCDDPEVVVEAVYIDDLCESICAFIRSAADGHGDVLIGTYPVHSITVGELADVISGIRDAREALMTDRVGHGFIRAINSTYLSYLPLKDIALPLKCYRDARGAFVEMLKTPDCGQVSFFTAGPGVTRGGHYHHTKTEKFLVVHGKARFRFKHMLTGERHEFEADGQAPTVVDTIPGWLHDITNIGSEELLVLLWANEIFDPSRPDTFASNLE